MVKHRNRQAKLLDSLVIGYAALSSAFLIHVYPVTPNKSINLVLVVAVAAAVASAARLSMLSVGFATVFLLGTCFFTISLSPVAQWLGWLYAVPLLPVTYVVVGLLIIVSCITVRDKGDLAALATGLLAASLLRIPGGHLICYALLSLFALVAVDFVKAVKPVPIYIEVKLWLLNTMLKLRKPLIGFVDFSTVQLEPPESIIEAFSKVKEATPPPGIYTVLSYCLAEFLILMALLAAFCRIADSFRKAAVEVTKLPRGLPPVFVKTVPIMLTPFVCFEFMIIAEMWLTQTLGCVLLLDPLVVTACLALIPPLALLVETIRFKIEVTRFEEEKDALRDSCIATVEHVDRLIQLVDETRCVDTTRYLSLLNGVKDEYSRLVDRVSKARMGELEYYRFVLKQVDQNFRSILETLTTDISNVVKDLLESCYQVRAWASKRGLPTDCREAIRYCIEALAGSEPLVMLKLCQRARADLVKYLRGLASVLGLDNDVEVMRVIGEIEDGVVKPSEGVRKLLRMFVLRGRVG